MSDDNYFDSEASHSQSTPAPIHNFGAAIDLILHGHVMRRLSWPDDGTVVTMRNDILSIFLSTDKKWHPLMVSIGDIMGEDWVIASPPRVN